MNLGIFWVIPHPQSGIAIISSQTPLDEAEEYGDCLTSPVAHIDAWEATKRGKLMLASLDASIRAVIAAAEYEDWPRGRIVFDRSINNFIAYADRQAMPYAAQIRACFTLPNTTIFRTDLHYCNARCIPFSNSYEASDG
jgi:hypothetical protein